MEPRLQRPANKRTLMRVSIRSECWDKANVGSWRILALTSMPQTAVLSGGLCARAGSGVRALIGRRHLTICICALTVAGTAQAAPNRWFGTWKLKREHPDQTPETLVYSDAGDGAMRMVSVEDKSVMVSRFDGAPAPDIGTGASQGWSLAIKATSAASYSWTLLKAGEARAQGLNTLAPDGRTFTEVSWPIGKRKQTITVTYERQ